MGYFGSMFSQRFGDILKVVLFVFIMRAVMLMANLRFGHFPVVDPALFALWDLISYGATEIEKAVGFKILL